MQQERRGASPEAIQHHYDVGNDFYRTWLDDSLTYSGAMWENAHDLEQAQERKLDYHANEARATGAARVLDIGCGWGSMLDRLVSHQGVRHAVGLTLSPEQARWIEDQKRPGIEVRVEGWGDHEPTEPYDAIISIGALEHFARIDQPVDEKIDNYRRFFSLCHDWLRPGGYLSVQAIAYGNLLRDDIRGGFVSQEIFPESDFVRLAELVEGSEFLFEIVRLRNDPEDYGRTCQEWLARLRKNRDAAVAAAGPDLTDKWEQYLDLSVRGWQLRATNLLRITMRRIDQPRSRERAARN
ncbi:MAG: class I SAM-dependent methyltransferase [Myxococcota bacterium]